MSCKQYNLGQPVRTVNNKPPDNEGNVNVDTALAAWPVGSIYTSTVATSPATLFGGTWEQIKDRFLWAKGDSDTAGATGGEKTTQLTTNNLPVHSHTGTATAVGDHAHNAWTDSQGIHRHTGVAKPNTYSTSNDAEYAGNLTKGAGSTDDAGSHGHNVGIGGAGGHTHTITIGNTGSNTAHNNMPPYLVVYCWKRTA